MIPYWAYSKISGQYFYNKVLIELGVFRYLTIDTINECIGSPNRLSTT